MNTRILELIKHPENLQIEDLKLLEPEIERLPYMQSLRALYLLGVNKYNPEIFQKELTKTAAYTTDKKILYHLINQEKKQEIVLNTASSKEEIKEESQETTPQKEEKPILTGIDFYTKNQPQTIEETPSTPIKTTTTWEETQYPPKPSIMDFYTTSLSVAKEENLEQKEEIISEENTDNPISEEVPTQEAGEWKPMQIEEFSSKQPSTKTIPQEEEKEVIDNQIKEEKPIINISFLNPDLSIPKEEIKQPSQEQEKNTHTVPNSNVSEFISTWQNWLKIDRTPQISEQEKKAAIIDKFIENNPKISPIKEEIDFVVKEKSDDISHLMTETLAQLYLEQKLYSKAINAYHILQEKHPEKKDYFAGKIEEINKSRGK